MKLARWSPVSLALGWTLLTGCSLVTRSGVEPFVCDVQPAYNQDGTDDTTSYRVNRPCLRGVKARLDACYKE